MTQSAYTFIMKQEGPDVIIEGSGSINLAGLSFGRTGNYPEGFMAPSTGIILVKGASDFYSGVTGPSSFGPGGQILATNPMGAPSPSFLAVNWAFRRATSRAARATPCPTA